MKIKRKLINFRKTHRFRMFNASICLLLLVLFPSVCVSGSYSIEYVDKLTAEKKLPGFCTYAGDVRWQRTPTGRALFKKYDPDWYYMHHYCWAILDNQNGYVDEALDNLRFVLERVHQSKLRIMALEYKANVLILNDREPEAVPVYYEIIQIKPDAEVGYIGLANIFINNGDKKTAREIANQGLTYLPESKKLKAFLK